MINRTEIFTRLQDVFRDSFDDPDIEIFDNMTAEEQAAYEEQVAERQACQEKNDVILTSSLFDSLQS